MNSSSEIFTGLSIDELEALADSLLAPTSQARMDDLLNRRHESTLLPEEDAELEQLLRRADQLTILKTRARYTLSHMKSHATGT